MFDAEEFLSGAKAPTQEERFDAETFLEPPSLVEHVAAKALGGLTRSVTSGLNAIAIEGQWMAEMVPPIPKDVLERLERHGWEDPHKRQPVEETVAWKLGEGLAKAGQLGLETDPAREKSFLASTLPEAIGNTIGYYGIGRFGGVGAVMLAGAFGGQTEQYKDAVQSGADKETALWSSMLGGVMGTTEVLPFEGLLTDLDKYSGGKVKKRLLEAGWSGLTEALQEIMQTETGNAIARWYYDNDRQVAEGVEHAGGAGGIAGVIGSLLIHPKARGRSKAQTVTEDDFVPPTSGPAATQPGGAYSDADVQAQFEAAQQRTGVAPDQLRYYPEGFGVQEEPIVVPPPHPSPVVAPPIPTGSETRTTGPATSVLPTELPPHSEPALPARASAPSSLASPVQDLLRQRFTDRTIAEATAAEATKEFGRRFHVWTTPNGLVLRLGPQTQAQPETTQVSSDLELTEAERLRAQVINEAGETQDQVDQKLVDINQGPLAELRARFLAGQGVRDAQAIRSNEGQVQVQRDVGQEGEGKGREDLQLKPSEEAGVKQAAQVAASQVQVSSEIEQTKQLLASFPENEAGFRSKLSAGVLMSKLRKQFPSAQLEVAQQPDGMWRIQPRVEAPKAVTVKAKPKASQKLGQKKDVYEQILAEEGLSEVDFDESLVGEEGDEYAPEGSEYEGLRITKLFSFDPIEGLRQGRKLLWRSKMQEVLEKRLPKYVTAQELREAIPKLQAGQDGFKAEEWNDTVRLTNFGKWLEKWEGQPIPRTAILEELRQNGVRVEEVVYDDNTATQYEVDDPESHIVGVYNTRQAAEEARERYINETMQREPQYTREDFANVAIIENLGAKYANQYQLPGGSNYVELVLTSPQAEEMSEDPMHFVEGEGKRQIGWIRGKEFVDAKGEKVFLIEEVQSPRHQKGREEGYRGTPKPEHFRVKQAFGVWEVYGPGDHTPLDFQTEAEAREYVDKASSILLGVPDAPFRESHLRLLARRAIRWAAERGIKKVAWTTGEQQAERWSLRQVADELYYDQEKQQLEGYKEGRRSWERDIAPQELSAYVGPELAKQLMSTKPQPTWTVTYDYPPNRFSPAGRTETYARGFFSEAEAQDYINSLEALSEEPRRGKFNIVPSKEQLVPKLVRVPEGIDFYRSKWPRKIYGFEGEYHNKSLLGVAMKEAMKPWGRAKEGLVRGPSKFDDEIGNQYANPYEFSVQPSIELTDEQVKHYTATPMYLYSADLLQGVKQANQMLDRLPGGGALTRLGNTYRKHLSIPSWAATVKEKFGGWYKKSGQIAAKHEEPLYDSLSTLDGWHRLSHAAYQKLKEFAWSIEGRLLKETPTPQMTFSKDAQGRKQVTLNPQYLKELEAFMRGKGFDEDAVQTFLATRRGIDQDFANHYNALAKNPQVDPTMLEQLEQYQGFIPNYLPHNFYGNHFIEGFDEKGELKARLPIQVGLIGKSLGATTKVGRLIKALESVPEYKGLKWNRTLKASDEQSRYYINTPVSVEVIGRVLDEAAKSLEAKGSARPELAAAATAIRKALPSKVLEIMRTKGFSNFAKRSGILGYEKQDLLRVLADYKVGLYGSLRKMETAREYARYMMESKPEKLEWEMLDQYFADQMAPRGRVDSLVATARDIMFMRYMAGRAKPAVVNLSNQIVTGIPLLGMHAGPVSAMLHTKSLGQITAQFAKESTQKLRRIGVFGHPNPKKNVLEQDMIDLIKRAQADGTVQPQMVREMLRDLKAGYKQVPRFFNRALATSRDTLTLPMETTEWYSRAATFKASAEAMANGQISNQKTLEQFGLKKGEKVALTDPRVYEFARMITLQSHGEYGMHNRPPVFRSGTAGKLASSTYTFRFFQHNLMELWKHMLSQGPRGWASFATSVAGQVVTGGLLKGVPFAATLMAMYGALTGDDPEEELRQALPGGEDFKDAALYGIGAAGIGGLPKVALGSSVEFDLPESVQELLKFAVSGQEPMIREDPTTEALGVVGGTVRDVIGAFNAWANGEPERATEYLAPLIILRDVLAANRLATKGTYTLTGRPIVQPGDEGPQTITTPEARMRALGFQPLSIEKGYRLRASMEKAAMFRKGAQTRLANRFANAFKDGDNAEMEAVLDEIMAWNIKWGASEHPEFMIDPKKAIETRMRPDRGDSRLRGRALELREAYGF